MPLPPDPIAEAVEALTKAHRDFTWQHNPRSASYSGWGSHPFHPFARVYKGEVGYEAVLRCGHAKYTGRGTTPVAAMDQAAAARTAAIDAESGAQGAA